MFARSAAISRRLTGILSNTRNGAGGMYSLFLLPFALVLGAASASGQVFSTRHPMPGGGPGGTSGLDSASVEYVGDLVPQLWGFGYDYNETTGGWDITTGKPAP